MPTFSQTKAAYLAAKAATDGQLTVLHRDVNLGQGYQLLVRFDTATGDLKWQVTGPFTDINQMPPAVIQRLGEVIQKIRDWLADNLPDLPVTL